MKIQWNKVTWHSWLAAVILFFGVFFLGIYIGVQYEEYQMYRQNLTAPPVTVQASTEKNEAENSSKITETCVSESGINDGRYTNEKYHFSFEYPDGWHMGDHHRCGFFQLYNYDMQSVTGSHVFAEGMNKIAVSVRKTEKISFLPWSDFAQKQVIQQVKINGRRVIRVDHYTVGESRMRSYLISLRGQDRTLSFTIYGDAENFDVLKNIVQTLNLDFHTPGNTEKDTLENQEVTDQPHSTGESATSPIRDPNEVAGTYVGTHFTDPGVKKKMSIHLTEYKPTVGGARASITIESEGEVLFTLLGGWGLTPAGDIYVTGEPLETASGTGSDITRVEFTINNDGTLMATTYDSARFAFEGLVFRPVTE